MKNFDWTRLAAIAEVLSSIAIVLTLFYLAVQTGQNTAATQAATRQGVLNGELWMLDKIIQYPSIEAGAEAIVTVAGISAEDNVRFMNILNGQFRIRENLWFQYQNGVLDNATWESYRNIFVGLMLGDPYMREYWEAISAVAMDRDFVAEIDELLADPPAFLQERSAN